MSRIYWDEKPENRLILHENNKMPGSSLVIDLYDDETVVLMQDSDDEFTKQKFEDLEESVEFNVYEYIDLLRAQANMLESRIANLRRTKKESEAMSHV